MVEPARELTTDDLREIKAKRQADFSRVQASLEEPADKVYAFTVTMKGEPRKLEFRRWTHEQANRLLILPFYHKFQDDKYQLTKEERLKLLAVQIEMVQDALVQPEAWASFLADPDNTPQVDMIWAVVGMMSGASKDYDEALREFFESVRGFNYGYFWYVTQGRMSSEIARLPDTDVKAANIFLGIWSKRVEEGRNK